MNDLSVHGMALLALLVTIVVGKGIGIARWARAAGRAPWPWVLGSLAADIAWVAFCAGLAWHWAR